MHAESPILPGMYDESQTCLFCGKSRTWVSVIMVLDIRSRLPLAIVTVCPKDRKTHNISEIYAKINEELKKRFDKVVL